VEVEGTPAAVVTACRLIREQIEKEVGLLFSHLSLCAGRLRSCLNQAVGTQTRGLHSSTSQHNLSHF